MARTLQQLKESVEKMKSTTFSFSKEELMIIVSAMQLGMETDAWSYNDSETNKAADELLGVLGNRLNQSDN